MLSHQTIRGLCQGAGHMIYPYHDESLTAHGMSYGASCHGYDVRVRERVVLWPGSFKLASTVERFAIPRDVSAEVKDKSTNARRGIALQNTILEAGWHGHLTLEISCHLPWWQPWRRTVLEAGTPIAQVVFHRLDEPTDRPYAGKYQDQEAGPQKARFR